MKGRSASRPAGVVPGAGQSVVQGDAPAAPSLGVLFEHYGVELERPRAEPGAVVTGEVCARCTWLVRADERSCPQCGAAGSSALPE